MTISPLAAFVLLSMPFVLMCQSPSTGGQSARNYYKELYAAGGLHQILADRVCFDDRHELETFFIFTESKVIREVMRANGSFGKAPKALQNQLMEEFLMFRGYDKGVPLSSEDVFRPDNGSWVSGKFKLDKGTAQVRFNISFETLRYKRSVEVQNQDGTFQPIISTYGRCEWVSPAVNQHGK